MAIVRLVGLLSFYTLITTCSAQRLDQVQDIEARLYLGPTIKTYTTYKLPNLLELFNSTDFNGKMPTVFYIHGLSSGPTTKLYPDVIQSLITSMAGIKNVVGIDWTNFSNKDHETIALPGVKKAGIAIAEQLNNAIQLSLLSPSNIEAVGFDMGCYLAGFIGREMKSTYESTIKSIIALDPARLGFFPFNKTGERLNANDAEDVYVIHTSAGKLGTPISTGSQDFWPNGGTIQPGCPRKHFMCDHFRALTFYAESLRNPSAFQATRSGSYQQFIVNYDPTGPREYSNMPPLTSGGVKGDFYLTTNSKPPYGRGIKGRVYSK